MKKEKRMEKEEKQPENDENTQENEEKPGKKEKSVKTDKYGECRDDKGRFTEGNPGKPPGTKHTPKSIKERFFDEFGNLDADGKLEQLAKNDTKEFLRMLIQLLPKETKIDGDGNLTIKLFNFNNPDDLDQTNKGQDGDNSTKS